MKKDEPDFVHEFSGTFETQLNPELKKIMEDVEKHKYRDWLLPKIKEMEKDLRKNNKSNQKSVLKFLLNNKSNHRNWKFKYENGEIYPKDISFPDPLYIQYPEPHVLLTDLYEDPEEWYDLREIIKDFAEDAYVSYESGCWLASIASSINCVEYIIKYEFFRNLKKLDKIKLKKVSEDYLFSLGKIKEDGYDCLTLLKIKELFGKKLEYLNNVRTAIYHFNPKKAKKVSQEGETEMEREASITDDMVKPILSFKVYSIMLELIEHFYNRKNQLDFVKESGEDWIKLRGYSEKDISADSSNIIK